jgi:hypothetical protein
MTLSCLVFGRPVALVCIMDMILRREVYLGEFGRPNATKNLFFLCDQRYRLTSGAHDHGHAASRQWANALPECGDKMCHPLQDTSTPALHFNQQKTPPSPAWKPHPGASLSD